MWLVAAGLDRAGLAGRGGVRAGAGSGGGVYIKTVCQFQGCKADLCGWCLGIFKKGVEKAEEAPLSWSIYESWCLSRALGAV